MRSASAIELGEIISVSRVSGALRVEIELPSADATLPEQSSCFSLASDPPNPGGLPVVANGRVTLRTLDGRHSVIVNSSQRIDEAAILGLRLGCGSDVRRDYLLRLPPVEVAAAQAPVVESRAPALPVQIPPAEAVVPEVQPALPAKRAPPRKPKPVVPKPRAAGDRLALSLTAGDEALSRRLAEPAPGPADYRAAGAEAEALNARLRELEAAVARLRADLGAPPPVPDAGRGLAAQRESAESQAPFQAPSQTTVRVTAAAPAESALAVIPRNLKPDAKEESGYSTAWLLAFAAGGALLALAAVALARRWSHRPSTDATPAVADRPALAAPGPKRPAADADVDAHVPPGPHTIEVVEPKSPLELAEFMLSFGRVDDAAMALEEYIANNPRSAIEPWRKLLGIYRRVGRRHAFEALARRMHKTFDVPAPLWDRSPDEQSAP